MKKTIFKNNEYFYSNSFEPNLTSNLIADLLEHSDMENKEILDLGCGCGSLGLSLIKKNPKSFLPSNPLCEAPSINIIIKYPSINNNLIKLDDGF